MKYSIDQVLEVLKQVVEPESGKDLVSLSAVSSLEVEEGKVSFVLALPEGNPFIKSVEKACRKALLALDENLEVGVLSTPRIQTGKITAGRKDDKKVLPGVKNIIAVASGKGGVGKSTISANMAVALAKTGAKVGLLDADVYGPSQPKMFGVENAKPEVKKVDGKDIIIPIEKYGVKLLSIGFFVKPEDALIWRGAMATSAITQFIRDTDWGELDYLILDLPPGTGDIHLTMVQTIPITGAVIVSTPQDMALADALRGIAMFRAEKIEVPIVGFIENMSWFTPEELPDNKYFIFGKNGLKELAERLEIPLLGQIPIVQGIRESGDNGEPIVLKEESIAGDAFAELAKNVFEKIEDRNAMLSPTKIVEIDPDAKGCST